MTGWTEDGLARSWRALAKADDSSEWRFIHLFDVGPVEVKAGCRFPGSREALIVSFPEGVSPGPGGLTDGRGFDVARVTDPVLGNRVSIALVRRSEGSQDIFAAMACDILRRLQNLANAPARDICVTFLGRVSDWQEFMARRRRPLSAERQLGLMGELAFLDHLRKAGIGAAAIDLWQGPLNAAQDFHVGQGAVEVKSSLAGKSFIAKINSIEQLDTERSPMILCAIQFEETADGADLPSLVAHLRQHMHKAGLSRFFDSLLLQAGYDDEHEEFYRRRLRQLDLKGFLVSNDFPCLRRAHLPAPIRKASYTLDVDGLEGPDLSLGDILQKIGATCNES